jgi:chemotaxis protein MotD
MLLAAIAAADLELQAPERQTTAQPELSQAAVTDGQPSSLSNTSAANDADVDTAFETAADPKTNIMQDSPLDPGAAGAPKSGLKPDKKANAEKTAADIAAASLPAQPQISVWPQPPIAPMAQAAVQTQAVASNDDDSDAVLGITGAANASSRAVSAPSAPSAAQLVAPTPSQPLTAVNDESADDSDVLSNIAPADQAKAATHVAEGKFTQARNPVSKPASQTASQPQASATVDDDADMTAEPSGVSAANKLSQTTAQATQQSNLGDTAQASPVPPVPQKPGAADKPVPDKIAGLLPPGTSNAAAGAKDPSQNPNSTTADSDSDSKSAHIAASAAPQGQSDVPQLPAHAATAALPQATLAINSAGTNAASGLTLSVHVASHDTGSQSSAPSTVTPDTGALAISVAARSLGGAKQFDIRLDPPELGRVEVRLSIDASGKTQAHMTADQPQTLELLQKDATNLTRALRDAGLDVSQNGLNFSLKGQGQNNGGQNGNFGNASRNLSLPAIAQSIEAAQPINIPYSLLGNARLDIHV